MGSMNCNLFDLVRLITTATIFVQTEYQLNNQIKYFSVVTLSVRTRPRSMITYVSSCKLVDLTKSTPLRKRWPILCSEI